MTELKASDLPPLPQATVVPTTNRYHLPPLTWDAVTNATGYQVIVQHLGVETQRLSTAETSLVVSNLTGDLDNYRFTCVATNSAGTSDESNPAPKKLITVWYKDGPKQFEPTNGAQFFTNATTIISWDAASLLKKD